MVRRRGSLIGRVVAASTVALVASGCTAAGGVGSGGAAAHAAVQSVVDGPGVIRSDGPLSVIDTSPDLNCAVQHVADADPQFFGGTGCMTAVSVAGVTNQLITPAAVPGGDEIFDADAPLVPEQQSRSGTGSAADPLTVTTVAANGVIELTQTDTYVVGQESYRTEIQVRNRSVFGPFDTVVFRAADCNLQESDYGFGSHDESTGSVACRGVADPSDESPEPGSRLLQWTPITAGSSYFEGSAYELWSAVDRRAALPNTCRCGSGESDYVDNAAGLSWSQRLDPFSSRTVSFVTTFSPAGTQPLVTSKSADSPMAAAGTASGYTVTVRNPNPEPRVLASISDDLPDGFGYRPGTTSGALTSDPVVEAQRLTWAGPVAVPGGGAISVHFGVTVSRSPGPYTNDASADAGALTVVPALGAAPVEVTGVPNDPPTVDVGQDLDGREGDAFVLSGSVVDLDSPIVGYEWSAAPGAGVDPGASCSIADPSALVTQAVCNDDGQWQLTLTANDGVNAPVGDSTTVTLANARPAATAPTSASGVVGSPVALDVDVADAGSNDTATCRAVWGDGTTTTPATDEAGRCRATHAYESPGEYDVRITATDDDGATSDPTTTSMTIAPVVNLPPTVDAGPALVVPEGSTFTTDAAITDPDGPTLVHSWEVVPGADVDAGTTCSSAPVPPVDRSGACDDDGSFTLRLTAGDTVNDEVVDSASLTVTNVAPSVAVLEFPPGPTRTGTPLTVRARIADAGTHDVLSCTVDWGDGTVVAGTFAADSGGAGAGNCSAQHAFAAGGSFLVTVTGTDDDGGAASASVSTFAQAPPVVDAGPGVTSDEGSPIQLSGSVQSPPGTFAPAPAWSFVPAGGVDAGASCFAPPAPSTQVTCTDDGSWTATMSVPDGFGGTVSDSTTVTVANASPGLGAIGGAGASTVGAPLPISATVVDPGTNDSVSCSVSWGDGTTSAGVVVAGFCSASHVYSSAGSFTVTLTAVDDDGGARSVTRAVSITAVSARTLFVSFGSPIDYRNSGALTSGRFTVVTDGRGVKSVTGTGSIPGRNAVALSVTIDVKRVGDLGLWAGTFTWSDGAFAGTTTLLTTDLGRRGAEIKGRQFALVRSTSGAWRVVDLQWAIVP